MNDETKLINRALGFLGERSISNPDAPETPAGRHLVNTFDDCRKEVLRRFPWNFAEVWAEIGITTAPPFGYSDAYSLPEDFLRLIWVGTIDETRLDYRMLYQPSPDFRRVIALDNAGASTLKISYSADIDKLHIWDPLALKVLSLWLALDAAKSVTGQDENAAAINEMLTMELADAVGVDGQEQKILRAEFSRVQDSRNDANAGGYFTRVEGYPTY